MLMHPDVLFGDLRFNGSMRLPGAYRSLARPSSAPEPSHPLTGVKATSYVVSSNPCNVQKRLVISLCISFTQRIIAPVLRGLKPFPGSVARPGASEILLYQWTRGDLNPRPRRCKRRALPAELRAL